MGTTVYLSTNLLKVMHTAFDGKISHDHIAGILAHELQHSLQDISNKLSGNSLNLYTHNIKNEYDSDIEALFIMDAAGFNPKAYCQVWEKFYKYQNSGGLEQKILEFIDEHPSNEERYFLADDRVQNPNLLFINRFKPYAEFEWFPEEFPVSNETLINRMAKLQRFFTKDALNAFENLYKDRSVRINISNSAKENVPFEIIALFGNPDADNLTIDAVMADDEIEELTSFDVDAPVIINELVNFFNTEAFYKLGSLSNKLANLFTYSSNDGSSALSASKDEDFYLDLKQKTESVNSHFKKNFKFRFRKQEDLLISGICRTFNLRPLTKLLNYEASADIGSKLFGRHVYNWNDLPESLFNIQTISASQAQQLLKIYDIMKPNLSAQQKEKYSRIIYFLLKKNERLSCWQTLEEHEKLVDFLFDVPSTSRDFCIQEILEKYDIDIESGKRLSNKLIDRAHNTASDLAADFFTGNKFLMNILTNASAADRTEFLLWLVSDTTGKENYPSILKKIKFSSDEEGAYILNFDDIKTAFKLSVKNDRDGFLRMLFSGEQGILKDDAELEKVYDALLNIFPQNQKEFIKTIIKTVVGKINSPNQKINALISLFEEIMQAGAAAENDGRLKGKLIAAIGSAGGIISVKILQILANNDFFNTVKDANGNAVFAQEEGKTVNEEVKRLLSNNAPLSKAALFAVLKEAGILDKVAFVGKRLGSASVAQAHLVRLKDGKIVAVKFKRLLIDVEQDKAIFTALKDLFDSYPLPNADRVSAALADELNLNLEADAIKTMGASMNRRNSGAIGAPDVIEELSNEFVIVEEYIEGERLDKLPAKNAKKNYFKIISEFFKQVFEDGIFHADLHEGNIFINKDGNLRFIDFGGVGKVSNKELLKQIFFAIYGGNVSEFLLLLKDYDPQMYKTISANDALKQELIAAMRIKATEKRFAKIFTLFNARGDIGINSNEMLMFFQGLSKIGKYIDNLGLFEKYSLWIYFNSIKTNNSGTFFQNQLFQKNSALQNPALELPKYASIADERGYTGWKRHFYISVNEAVAVLLPNFVSKHYPNGIIKDEAYNARRVGNILIKSLAAAGLALGVFIPFSFIPFGIAAVSLSLISGSVLMFAFDILTHATYNYIVSSDKR
ncbi:MAG: hypothetical protein LBQ47_00860, partial [Endomicrobium sp.]|nr:hypothetical protein [Endomicrobium sp.]